MATTARARDARYGRRGGNWAPELVGGEAPYGVIDGKRTACPTPVYARCQCGGWWVVPSTAARPCDRCGEPFVLDEAGAA